MGNLTLKEMMEKQVAINIAESTEEILTQNEFQKAFPSDKFEIYTQGQLTKFVEDVLESKNSMEICKAKKDISQLQKKLITNKSGKKQGVWVKNKSSEGSASSVSKEERKLHNEKYGKKAVPFVKKEDSIENFLVDLGWGEERSLKYIDITHFTSGGAMGTAHVAQYKDHPKYNEIKEWLKKSSKIESEQKENKTNGGNEEIQKANRSSLNWTNKNTKLNKGKKKDLSHLQKKLIINKKGKKQGVWVETDKIKPETLKTKKPVKKEEEELYDVNPITGKILNKPDAVDKLNKKYQDKNAKVHDKDIKEIKKIIKKNYPEEKMIDVDPKTGETKEYKIPKKVKLSSSKPVDTGNKTIPKVDKISALKQLKEQPEPTVDTKMNELRAYVKKLGSLSSPEIRSLYFKTPDFDKTASKMNMVHGLIKDKFGVVLFNKFTEQRKAASGSIDKMKMVLALKEQAKKESDRVFEIQKEDLEASHKKQNRVEKEGLMVVKINQIGAKKYIPGGVTEEQLNNAKGEVDEIRSSLQATKSPIKKKRYTKELQAAKKNLKDLTEKYEEKLKMEHDIVPAYVRVKPTTRIFKREDGYYVNAGKKEGRKKLMKIEQIINGSEELLENHRQTWRKAHIAHIKEAAKYKKAHPVKSKAEIVQASIAIAEEKLKEPKVIKESQLSKEQKAKLITPEEYASRQRNKKYKIKPKPGVKVVKKHKYDAVLQPKSKKKPLGKQEKITKIKEANPSRTARIEIKRALGTDRSQYKNISGMKVTGGKITSLSIGKKSIPVKAGHFSPFTEQKLMKKFGKGKK